MESLSATDLHTVLDVARELGTVRDLDELHAGVLPQLRRLVAYDTASFNEIAPNAGEAVVTAVEPTDAIFDGAEEIFGAYAHQNPLIAAAQRPGDVGVLKFSDFISRRQLHSLDIYDLVYSGIEVEHQIAFTLPAPSAHVIGFALNRKRGDFSERDRYVLRAIRPFVVQAYADAAARARTRATVAALERRLDAILLEQRAPLCEDAVRALELTGRETQVLRLLAHGLSNGQIAAELALSERTIAKHLEHIYSKLDVGNRTAAVARARF